MKHPAHIILEGPDGSGKTTLARKLCAALDMDYHHEGPPPAGASLLHYYADLLANTSHPTVFDRLHLGELVYGPLLRGAAGLQGDDVRLMNRLLRARGVITFKCFTDWETCLANNRAKTELIKDETVMRAAHDGWRVLFSGRQFVVNGYDYDYTNARSVPIIDMIGCQIIPWVRPLPDGVIGNATFPKMLFVGEQPNSGTLDLPFFGTERSSGFLNGCIQDAELREEDIAFTNALDLDGRARNLRRIVSRLESLTTVVTLGRVAAQQAERQQLPFVKVVNLPHPQYWKRFHASKREHYVEMIRSVTHVAA